MRSYSKSQRATSDHSKSAMNYLLRESEKAGRLTDEEILTQFSLIKQGGAAAEQAKNKVTRSVAKLVMTIVNTYVGLGLHEHDLFAAGLEGVAEAINHFDPTRGIPFRCFVHNWIRYCICREIDEHSTIVYYPSAKRQEERKAKKETPSDMELWENIDALYDTTAPGQRACGHTAVPLYAISLDRPLAGDGEATILDIYDNGERADAAYEKRDEMECALRYVGGRLDEDEMEVVKAFSYYDSCRHTTQEIATMMGVSADRVYYLKKKAFTKIRHMRRWREVVRILFGYTTKRR